MAEFNKQFKERWQQKKRKAGNWTSLLYKILLLIALIYVVSKISTSKNIDWSKLKGKPDTLQVVPN
jgi:hypothetical protein